MDLTLPDLAPLRTLTMCLVSWSLLTGMTCLLMPSPSIKTLLSLRISTMVASLPASGPQLTLATRPTSTNLVQPYMRECLPFYIVVNYIEYKIMIMNTKPLSRQNFINVPGNFQGSKIGLADGKLWVTYYGACLLLKLFYMSSSKKTMTDLQTQVNSPAKHIEQAFMQATSASKRLNLQEVEVEHTSLTEKQLLSRDLIKKIILKGKAKTIRHQVGKIDDSTCLYAKPRTYEPNQFRFDNIPPRNNFYSSLGSAKISQIRKGLKTRPISICTKNQNNRYSCKSQSRAKPQQADFRNQRVAVSGLVTYKFASVNAQRSLASNKIDHEQKLKEEIRKANQSRDCSSNRFKKILLKQSSKRYKDQARKQKNIMENLDMSTDLFLQKIEEDNEREQLVYGEKAKKLCFIKEYMALESTNYEEGRHIVDQIQRCKTQTNKRQEVRRIKTQENEDVVFERRRVPKLNKNINVRYLTFVQ